MIKQLPKPHHETGCHTEWNYVWKKWNCYWMNENVEDVHFEEAATEADARAKMLIYLVEKKLLPCEAKRR